jgi:hypothetical protein
MSCNGEVMKREFITKWVIERKMAKDNDAEEYPVMGALLGC